MRQSSEKRRLRTTDANAAIGCWHEAAGVRTAAVRVRIQAAHAWGRLSYSFDDKAPDAALGYATAVGLLPLLAWRGVDRAEREQILAYCEGLAGNAAAAAIRAGRPDRATELLEHGRGVLWSQLLETRTDLAALCDAAPGLATQLMDVRAALDN